MALGLSAIDKFNSNLTLLINTLQSKIPQLKEELENEYKLPVSGDKYLNHYWQECKIHGEDLSAKSEIIFSREFNLLPSIDFYTIWNDEGFTEGDRKTLWQYLHSMYIFAFEHKRPGEFSNTIQHFKEKSLDLSTLKPETQTFINILDKLTNDYENPDSNVELDDEEEDSGGLLDGLGGFDLPELLNSNIGNLAKEIASEIDPKSLNINMENPQEMLKNLMSGKLEEGKDGGIMNLVKTITDKVQSKVASGEVNETELFGEAQKLMKKLGKKGGGLNGFGSNIMKSMMSSDLMKNMTEEEKSMFEQAAHALSGGSPGNVKKSMDLKSTRDRLKKKLEEKRANKKP